MSNEPTFDIFTDEIAGAVCHHGGKYHWSLTSLMKTSVWHQDRSGGVNAAIARRENKKTARPPAPNRPRDPTAAAGRVAAQPRLRVRPRPRVSR